MNNYFAIVFFALSYFIFFGLLLIGKAKKSNRLFGYFQMAKDRPFLIKIHIAGIFLFGILPFIYSDPDFIKPKLLSDKVVIITSIGVINFILLALSTSKKDFHKSEKFYLRTIPSNNYLFKYFITRILFICSYEMWFRGFLFNSITINYGLGTAILINVLLYSLIHTVNGKKEMYACVPFGIFLCWLSIWSESIIPAIVIHLALTLGYELNFLQKLKNKISLDHENIFDRRFRIFG